MENMMFWKEEDEVEETKFSKFKWNRCLACRRNQPNFRESPSHVTDALGPLDWLPRALRQVQGPDGEGTPSHPESARAPVPNVEQDPIRCPRGTQIPTLSGFRNGQTHQALPRTDALCSRAYRGSGCRIRGGVNMG